MTTSDISPVDRIPATIISGFLGSGKTTLLNRILQAESCPRMAVLVNDFGSINIDTQLIKSNDGEVMSLANGCICCNVSDDLMGQLEQMLNAEEPPEQLLIEASGVSDPGRIARILNYRMFRDRVRIDAVLNLLDAAELDHAAEEFEDLIRWQLKQADIVILNKIDLSTAEQLASLKRKWIPADKLLLETCHANLPLELILGVDAHAAPQSGFGQITPLGSDVTEHGELFESRAWHSEKPLSVEQWNELIGQLPEAIYRAKGVFSIRSDSATRLVLQKVGSRLEWSEETDLDAAGEGSSLVMIAKRGGADFARLEQMLEGYLSA